MQRSLDRYWTNDMKQHKWEKSGIIFYLDEDTGKIQDYYCVTCGYLIDVYYGQYQDVLKCSVRSGCGENTRV